MPAFKQRHPDGGGGTQRGGRGGGGGGDSRYGNRGGAQGGTSGYSCDGSWNGGRCAVGSNISSRGVGGGSYAQMYGQATPYTSDGRGVALGDGYVTDPYQMASISQQMGGMMLFEPGLSAASQQNFVFQPTKGPVAGDFNYGRGQRGGRSSRGRPY
ncbi:unnamed protein product [Schistosoma spindalis]|nr:unnamed protein product [Schistosoma spindale]